MDYIGLTAKFPVNRPLTDSEIAHHLPQSRPSRSAPLYQLSVIKMNSTYLECCDKYFGDKGFLTVLSAFCIGIAFCMLCLSMWVLIKCTADWPTASDGYRKELIFCFIAFPILIIFMSVLIYLNYRSLRKEIFCFTHYPIRFNRKTRKVHVFRFDGTVMTEDWDKLYFTLCESKFGNWEVRGHRLDEDKKTVLETFALTYFGHYDVDRENPLIWAQWEFVRRYMEEGPEKLAGQVEWVMDIAEKRETFARGFWRQYAEFAPIPPVAWLMSPLLFIYNIGRWIATRTSKIPVWPEEIEKECKIVPNDPYIRDAQHLAKPEDHVQEKAACLE
jgi:amino acid transporter